MALRLPLLLFMFHIFPAWAQPNIDSLNQLGICTEKGFAIPNISGMPRSKGVEVYQERGPSYNLTSNFKNQGFSSTEEIRRTKIWRAKLRAPILNKDQFKLVLGLKYKQQEYAFKNPDSLTNVFHQNLKDKPIRSVGFTIDMINCFKGNKYLVSRASFRLNGDFGKKDLEEHFKQSYTLLLGFKKGLHKSWGVGASYSNSFGRPTFYPLLFVDYKFKPKWAVRALLPVSVQLLFMPNEKNIFSFHNKLEGDNYNLNFPTFVPSTLYLDNADFKTYLTYEREIYDFFWIGISGGVRFNINFDIYDSDNYFDRNIPLGNTDNLVINNDIPATPFVRIGLFLVPPRNWLK